MRSIFAIFMIAIIIIGCNSNDSLTDITLNETQVQKIIDADMLVFQSEFEELLKDNPERYRIINIGSSGIPGYLSSKTSLTTDFKDLFLEENINLFSEKEIINVLYDDTANSAYLAGLMLSALGSGEYRVLVPDPESTLFERGDDYAIYDYQHHFAELVSKGELKAPDVVFEPPPAPKKVVLKKKAVKKEEEEGC